jgi:NDP-sugar pyrophosphorylase family protein
MDPSCSYGINPMQCLILAGGLGTRMQHLSGDLPKALIPVNGRPFADHQLSWLAGAGVERVVYALSHGSGAIRDYVGDGGRWGLSVTYSEDGSKPLGTAGAIRSALDQGLLDDGFYVIYGDSYLRLDMRDMWRVSENGSYAILSVFCNDGAWDASNVIMDGERLALYEKDSTDEVRARMTHIDYGLCILTREVIKAHVPSGQVVDLAKIYNRLSVAGQLTAFEATERFYEVGSPQGLADFEAYLNDG